MRPEFFNALEKGFKDFFVNEVEADPLRSEFLIPTFIGKLLEKKEIAVKVLKSEDTWYGMTYKEDGSMVRESIEKLVEAGLYPVEL